MRKPSAAQIPTRERHLREPQSPCKSHKSPSPRSCEESHKITTPSHPGSSPSYLSSSVDQLRNSGRRTSYYVHSSLSSPRLRITTSQQQVSVDEISKDTELRTEQPSFTSAIKKEKKKCQLVFLFFLFLGRSSAENPSESEGKFSLSAVAPVS